MRWVFYYDLGFCGQEGYTLGLERKRGYARAVWLSMHRNPVSLTRYESLLASENKQSTLFPVYYNDSHRSCSFISFIQQSNSKGFLGQLRAVSHSDLVPFSTVKVCPV